MTKLQGVLGELQNFHSTLVGTILMGKRIKPPRRRERQERREIERVLVATFKTVAT